jgi:NAD+ kinase
VSGFSIHVVGDPAHEGVADAAKRLIDSIGGRVEVRKVDLVEGTDLSATDASLVVVLGGDGAILAAARRLGANPAPVLGINFGKLGFLAGLRAIELETAVADVIVARNYRVSRRMRLVATVRRADGVVEPPQRGLNDAVVERWDARSLSVDFIVDGELATTYRGDGVVVATPTGSTAHSLAAGGPIVEPEMEAFVVSPICAHSVSNRPLVLGAEQVILLRVGGGSKRPGLAVDGQVLENLREGDEVEIRRSPHAFHLAVPKGRRFFEVLRSRLQWAGQPPYEREGS